MKVNLEALKGRKTKTHTGLAEHPVPVKIEEAFCHLGEIWIVHELSDVRGQFVVSHFYKGAIFERCSYRTPDTAKRIAVKFMDEFMNEESVKQALAAGNIVFKASA
jgi:hypothetical protein